MAIYERRTRIRAPLEEVWDFHSRPSGLAAVTPDWMGLRIEASIGPDGERDPETLKTGAELDVSVRPFGVGPRVRWTSAIVERRREAGSAFFRDEMVRGPFARWVHTHSFFADGEETVLCDRVEYEMPWPLPGSGRTLDALARTGFEPTFRHRHRRTKELLESDGAARNRRSEAPLSNRERDGPRA